MIWPFNRKPKAKPLNPGPINEDWAYGDLAECLGGENWIAASTGLGTAGPEQGDVCKVLDVKPAHTDRFGDGWFLELGGWPRTWFGAISFRKVPPLNSEADAEFTEQIKALKPKRVRA